MESGLGFTSQASTDEEFHHREGPQFLTDEASASESEPQLPPDAGTLIAPPPRRPSEAGTPVAPIQASAGARTSTPPQTSAGARGRAATPQSSASTSGKSGAATQPPASTSPQAVAPASVVAGSRGRSSSAASNESPQGAPPPRSSIGASSRAQSSSAPSNATPQAAPSAVAANPRAPVAAPGTLIAPPPQPPVGAGTWVAPPPAPPLGSSVRIPPPAQGAPGRSSPPFNDSARKGDAAETSSRASVGRYHILDKLGSGGMGVVYSAYDPDLHRRVAIKLLHPDANTVVRTDGASRLLREAQAMARLSHPNVVSVYDAGTFAGRVFITMELVEGLSLRHWLRAEHRSWRDVLDLFRQAGRGLAAAHAAGLVHRDFKPANVLVNRDGRAQVTDFGLARNTADLDAMEEGRATKPSRLALRDDDLLESPLTEAGLVMGTPAYMPPEQHEDGRTDARGDQFSFCASLYEALYGQLPFEGKQATAYLQESLANRVRQPPRGCHVPAWLFRAITRGLAPTPDERYPSMEALLTELGKDPSVVWRRRSILAAGFLLIYGFMGVTWWMGNRRHAPCLGAEARLAGIWDTSRKDTVSRAFAATNKPQAPEFFSRVAQSLDAFAQEWAGMHQEACEATRVHGHQSDAVLSLRMACLERRRSTLDAVVGVLAQTDAESLTTSLDAAQRLPSVADCANVDALRLGLPESPEQRQRVEKIRAGLDRTTALVDAGRYEQANEELKATLEQARALDYRPVLAEALELEGRLGLVLGDEPRAQKALREALLTAQATRHDEVAARAAARLVTTLSQTPAMEEWSIAQAKSCIERAGGTPDLEALLQTSLARNAFLRGQYAQAAEAFGRSAMLREQAHGAVHLLTLESLRNQAASLSRTPEAEHTARLLRRVLETTKEVMGPDHPQTAMAANAVGYHLTVSRRFEEAIPFLEQAVALEERAMGANSATLSYPLNNLATALESLRRYAEARKLRERALALDLETHGPSHPETASDQALLAELALSEGRTRDAMDLAQRSTQAYEAFQKGHPDQAAPLTTLGLAQLALGKPREARATLERALALRTATPGPGDGLAATRFALARALPTHEASRARALAQQALGFYGAEPAGWSTEAQRVKTWMSGRSTPAP
ncbi:protein kinase [Myxococcus llanfairpwllgwyngyllgogerychwyrndrobwllllantysiliogogogochensis]|uniref:Protein kinase n=1 Tax=Myxococcus llanfairpwllgwyngyllgogerychwyrndrobwllllantysiliogogogochensis TaxID=2590453 RepID=A0A540WTJ1_9BACT|nr:protein kinase [Myxococcus llanfairpwllgwyngyllgogerychwyrndrobwllllantysiliogogogochensis]